MHDPAVLAAEYKRTFSSHYSKVIGLTKDDFKNKSTRYKVQAVSVVVVPFLFAFVYVSGVRRPLILVAKLLAGLPWS